MQNAMISTRPTTLDGIPSLTSALSVTRVASASVSLTPNFGIYYGHARYCDPIPEAFQNHFYRDGFAH
jgi:hypothetical protein